MNAWMGIYYQGHFLKWPGLRLLSAVVCYCRLLQCCREDELRRGGRRRRRGGGGRGRAEEAFDYGGGRPTGR